MRGLLPYEYLDTLVSYAKASVDDQATARKAVLSVREREWFHAVWTAMLICDFSLRLDVWHYIRQYVRINGILPASWEAKA